MSDPSDVISSRHEVVKERILMLVGTGCAATSGLAILLHWSGLLLMPAAVSFVSVPGALALVIAGVVARHRHQEVFLHRLAVGSAAGLLATIAYDGSRWLLQAPGWIPFDGFMAIPMFGQLILGVPRDQPLAQAIGWIYHFWNGISFGLMYAFVAGPARWRWGVVWSMGLEWLMVLSYPGVFGVMLSNWGFWVLSVAGHVCQGVTWGLLMERYGALPGERRGVLAPFWRRTT